jgi:lysophospholipase L1-like esterase
MSGDVAENAAVIQIGWKKTVAYSLLPLLLLFGGLEVAARVVEIWVPPMSVDYGQGFDANSRLFVRSPNDPGRIITNPAKETSFKKQEFSIRKAPRTLRIFALGESSVNYLDYEFPLLAKRLEQTLSDKCDHVEIINCGGLSYGSHRLVPIASEIMGYEPDLVMVYLGHNEFEEIEQLDLAGMKTVSVQRALGHSALWRFLRDRLAGWKINQLQNEHNRRILAQSAPDTAKNWMHEFTPQEVAERMDKFRANYGKIIAMCRENGVPIVIGSIPSNLVKPVFPKEGMEHYREVLDLYAKGEYEKGAARGREILKTSLRHQSSDLENDIIRLLAKENNIPLADVEKAVIDAEPHHVPGETLFNDHCHLNPKGNEILIKTYEAEILKMLGAK